MNYFESTSLHKLEGMYKQETDPLIKTKLLAILQRKEKKKIHDISKALRISESTVNRSLKRFREEGREGLHNKHGGGNPGYLTEKQKQQLIQFIEIKTPTSREINAYVQKHFGKSYHPFSVPRLMKTIGFSKITPRKRHYKTDKTRQEEWKRIFKKKSRNTWVWVTESSFRTSQ